MPDSNSHVIGIVQWPDTRCLDLPIPSSSPSAPLAQSGRLPAAVAWARRLLWRSPRVDTQWVRANLTRLRAELDMETERIRERICLARRQG